MLLKKYSLDDWLLGLIKKCRTFAELETKLTKAVRASQEPEQTLQVARTLMQALQPIYSYTRDK